MYTAADFTHFIKPTLVFIVSFTAICAASVAFLFPLFLQEAEILALSQMICFLGMNNKYTMYHEISKISFMFF